MKTKAVLLTLSLILVISTSAVAANASSGKSVLRILKEFKNNRTNAPIRLTSNKNKLIRLERDASSVVVNNPNHASVMLDTPRLLIIVPHQPGATSFTVLDENGETIIEKDVIITNVQPKYVRIRRMCGDSQNCEANSYFYCPDGCYEVTSVPNDSSTGNEPSPLRPAGNFAAGMGAQTNNSEGQEE